MKATLAQRKAEADERLRAWQKKVESLVGYPGFWIEYDSPAVRMVEFVGRN